MLKLFKVRNYKNFKDEVVIDFGKVGGYQFSTECVANECINKMIIYGMNATGKTNLGKAIRDIVFILYEGYDYRADNIINADSEEKAAFFYYKFEFNEKEIEYHYSRLAGGTLTEEKLYIDKKLIFACDFEQKRFNFDNLNYIKAETINVERYIRSVKDENGLHEMMGNQIPFLRWMINNTAFDPNSVLLKLSHYIDNMGMVNVSTSISGLYSRKDGLIDYFYELLEEKNALVELEEFLNVMGVKCELVLKTLPDGQKELYFKHKKLIPFYETASSGTIALMNLYQRFVLPSSKASFMYVDEFDAFCHYEMARKLVEYFKNHHQETQVIMTTHNTNLMTNRLMRPDCLFILSREGKLTALCDATSRELREGHNLEKMYISGEFQNYE